MASLGPLKVTLSMRSELNGTQWLRLDFLSLGLAQVNLALQVRVSY